MKYITVTGGIGFMGSHFVRKCLINGWQCRVIDKMTYVANYNCLDEFIDNSNFVFEKIDINDVEHLYESEYIINFAAESDVGSSIQNSDKFIDTNIKGVHHLLELIRNQFPHKKPTFLHISTDEVYGDINIGSFKETDILKPSNPYAASKAAGEMLIQGFHRTYNIPYIIVRPTNNYGIDQYPEKLIPRTIKCLNLGQKISLHNHGLPIRSWLHAEDTAEAIIHLMTKGVKNEIYNIGGSTELQNIQVVEQIISLYTKEIQDSRNFMDFN